MSVATPATRTSDMLYMAERMTGDFPLVVMTLDQENLPPHGHDFVELVFVNAGTGVHVHGGRRYPIFAGDCFVVMPGERHGYDDEHDLRITNVLFFPRLLEHHASDLAAVPGFVHFFSTEPIFRNETAFRHKLHLSASQQKTMAMLCGALRRELDGRGEGYKSMCSGLLTQLIVFVSRCFAGSLKAQATTGEMDSKRTMVEAAMAYLERNYGNDVRVEDVARSAFISASRLSHVFRQTTGMSLTDYLSRVRIDRAQQLLAESDQSIAEISYSLGIESPAYFTRLFRKMTGQSPSEFRRATRTATR